MIIGIFLRHRAIAQCYIILIFVQIYNIVTNYPYLSRDEFRDHRTEYQAFP